MTAHLFLSAGRGPQECVLAEHTHLLHWNYARSFVPIAPDAGGNS